ETVPLMDSETTYRGGASTTSSPRHSSRRRSRRFARRSPRWDARRSTSSSVSSSGARARPRTLSSERGSSSASRPRLREGQQPADPEPAARDDDPVDDYAGPRTLAASYVPPSPL